ncbi:cytochrome P450 [Streptomyces sp. SP17BM10]|uniref:cytochrome P450 n=1 Tax=Streptomyces sp. SP17BM10 TaxID=3002530 RepID=UPI002E775A2C|nr:cytochrome P450 [Streptomyces sp. SP17BM10]MEE1788728.1 cytochrome P450 [Streptomyces sp. SP17BM10]
MPHQYTSATAPGALPLLGHVPAFVRRPYEFVAGLPAHGDLVRLRLGPMDAYVACHPDLVRRMLTEDRTYDKGGLVVDKAREVFGDGLATCPAAAHRRQRRMVQPAFHRDRLPGYAAMMADEIVDVTAPWRDGEVVDVPAAMYRLTTAVTARCLFAAHERAGSLPVHRAMDVVTHGVARRIMMPLPGADRIPTPGNRRYHRARADLAEITRRLVADYRAAGTDHRDLLSMLLAARDEDGSGLTDEEIHDQVITFLLAGMETTAATLSWAWTLLAAHPAVRERLHAELDTVLDGRPARHEDLPALPLTARVVNETLRLYPVSWLLSRVVTGDGTELGGHHVPAGATVLFSPYLLHRRADLFPRPDRFDPDRWLDTARPTLGTYAPFGAGARRCIGDAFGTTEAVLAIATIAARWTLTPTPGRPVRPMRSAAMRPRPFTATLTRRR